MSFEQVLRSPSAKRRGVLCLAAVVLAYAGQWILSSTPSPRRALAHGEPASVVAGTGLLLLGAILFLVAWHRQRDPDALTAMPAVPPRDARWWSLGMAALALWAGALWMQARHGETATMRAAWVASVSLLALAAWGSQRGQAGTPVIDAVPRRTALALLSVIGLGAFLLRFVELATLPLAHHGDMAMMGLGSRELLRGETGWFGVGWAWIPWLGYAPGALAMRLFGDDLWGLRMASVLGGTVAVVSTYGIGATIHSRRVGLLAAAVGAVGYVDIHFGRIPGYIDPLPWLVLGLYGVARGLRTGRDAAFLAGGMSLGVGCLMYFSGRIAPLVVASWILYLVVFHRRFALARIGGFALVALGALVILGPQLVFFAQHSEVVLGRGGVFVFTAESMEHLKRGYGVDTSAAVLFEQTWRSLLMFNFTRTGAFQAPLPWPAMSGLLAPMLVLGAGWAAGRPRSAGPALVGLWLAVVLVVGSMLTLEAPFWPRLVVLLPAAALLTAFGLDRTAQAAGAALAGERRGGCWIAAGLAALLVVAGAMNWIRYAERMRHWVEPADWLGRLVSAAPAETGFCMVRGPRSFEEEHIRFLAAGRDLVTVPPGEIEEHLLQCVGEARVWVLYEPFHRDLLSTLRARWPGGREERHDEPDGGMGPLFWHPPAEAVAAARPAALLTAWPAESVDAAGSPLAAGRDRALLAAASERVERLALAADGDRRTAWSTAGPQQGGEWLVVELPALAVVTEVRLDSQRLPTAHPRGLTVETSADGRAFAAASAEVVLGPETRAALAAPAVGRWIRLTQTGSDPDHPWSVYEVAVFARFGDGQARFARADLSAARLEGFRVEMAQQLPNAVDGDPRTRWDSGRPQQGGEWLQVELSSEGLVADVWLDTTGSPNDYPRGLSVLHSRDGEIFEPAGIVVRGTTRMHVALDPPVRARWLRIEQTGREEQFYWSVHDLELWGDWSDQ